MPLGWAYLLDRFLQHRDHHPITFDHFGTTKTFRLGWDEATRVPRDAVNEDFKAWCDATRRKRMTTMDVNKELRVLFEAGAVRKSLLTSSSAPTIRLQNPFKQYHCYEFPELCAMWTIVQNKGYVTGVNFTVAGDVGEALSEIRCLQFETVELLWKQHFSMPITRFEPMTTKSSVVLGTIDTGD